MPQIAVENLTKTYRVAERLPGVLGALFGLVRRKHKTIRALDGISFSLDEGELVGYIGPNGAGKSTTIKILSGILVPDSGKVNVLERTPWKERKATVAEIGVVFGQRTQLWWDLPAVESFELLRDIYRVPEAEYRRNRDEMVDLLDISGFLDTPVRQLSLGQRMRCDLAAALLHSPRILFLDEPTIGLDAVSKLAIRDFIKRLNKDRSVTIILATHDMADIEALARRVLVIHEGKILTDGTLDDLREAVTREKRLTVELIDHRDRILDADLEVVKREGRRITFRFDAEKVPVAEIVRRVTAAVRIGDLLVENPPIEEIIARIYGGPGN